MGGIYTVNLLLGEIGARVDVTDGFSFPTLMVAFCGKVNLTIVRAFLPTGADPNHLAEVCDNGAFTALRLAVERLHGQYRHPDFGWC